MTTRFDWDPDKAARNWIKHSVSFPTAVRAFSDSSLLIRKDRVVDGEQRWQLLGKVDGVQLLVVVHTAKEQDDLEVVRIISARIAESWERRAYEEQDSELYG